MCQEVPVVRRASHDAFDTSQRSAAQVADFPLCDPQLARWSIQVSTAQTFTEMSRQPSGGLSGPNPRFLRRF